MRVGESRGWAVVLGSLAVGAMIWHCLRYDFFSDDGYIVLRYARNLIDGFGPVFNVGERVEGVTSPLWLLLVAAIGWMGVDLEIAARLLGLLFSSTAVILSMVLARGLMTQSPLTVGAARGLWPWMAPALLAANGSYACWASAGLEAPMTACLVVAACCLFVRGAGAGAGWLSAALIWARPEGAVVPLALVAAALAARTFDREAPSAADAAFRRARSHFLFAVFAGLAALVVLRFLYYGEILPNTYYAKTGGGLEQVRRGLGYLADYAGEHETFLVLLPVLAVAAVCRNLPLRATAWVAIAWLAAVAWVGGDGLPMFRFLVPVMPLLYALIAVSMAQVCCRMRKWGRLPRLGPAVGAVAMTVGLAYLAASPPRRPPYYGLYRLHLAEVAKWTRVGQALGRNAAAGTTVAVAPIGAIGYFSQLPVIDLLGLTDRHIARVETASMGEGWAGHEKHDADYVMRRCPTYLLLNNVDTTPAPRDAAARPFLPRDSQAVEAREGDFYEGDVLATRYRPRSLQIGAREFLNVYELTPEWLGSPECPG